MDLTKCLSTHNANDHNTYAPTMSMANMKRLPKGLSEFANRRTDTTIAKRKKTRGQTTTYKNTTQKTNDRGTRIPLNKIY